MAVISWKCVAKRQKQLISVAIYSAMAQASPKPSLVEVPLPNSSMIIRLLLVAVYLKRVIFKNSIILENRSIFYERITMEKKEEKMSDM